MVSLAAVVMAASTSLELSLQISEPLINLTMIVPYTYWRILRWLTWVHSLLMLNIRGKKADHQYERK